MNPISTHRLLMIRPARFGYNEQTRSTNAFQAKNYPRGHGIDIKLDSSVPGDDRSDSISRQYPFVQQALLEFDQSVARIQAAGVHVTVWNDSPHPTKPDAVFLNNWFSTHPGGRYILYPMMAENRRIEIDPVHVAALEGIGLHKSLDLSPWTTQQQFLEGTGSLVFDHLHRVVFATESPRTHRKPAELVAQHLNYTLIYLRAQDKHGTPPYHTNVVLAVGPSMAFVCLEVLEPSVSLSTQQLLRRNQRPLIEISEEQMGSYCANVLEVQNTKGEPQLIASRTAWNAFTEQQRKQISGVLNPIILDIPLIERVGGGSARCILAELFGVPANP